MNIQKKKNRTNKKKFFYEGDKADTTTTDEFPASDELDAFAKCIMF